MTSILRLFIVIFTLFYTTSANGAIESRHGSFSAGARQNFLNQNGPSTTQRNYIVSPPSYNEKFESYHHVGFGDQGIVQSENNNNFNNNNNQLPRSTTRRSKYNFNGNHGFNHNQHRHRNYYDDEDDQPTWGSSNVNTRVEKDSEEKN
jgi:hypothetical protein